MLLGVALVLHQRRIYIYRERERKRERAGYILGIHIN